MAKKMELACHLTQGKLTGKLQVLKNWLALLGQFSKPTGK
jgi:hypothetical protein